MFDDINTRAYSKTQHVFRMQNFNLEMARNPRKKINFWRDSGIFDEQSVYNPSLYNPYAQHCLPGYQPSPREWFSGQPTQNLSLKEHF